MFRYFIVCLLFFGAGPCVLAQGGPPFITNDPGTPGPFNWEINIGYIPTVYSDLSVSHVPDLDINFGVGERLQLTYENAWARVAPNQGPVKYGLGQSNFGAKWRFYDAGEQGWQISTFPQVFLNNPNNSVNRGITPAGETLLLPLEFARKAGPVDIDFEIGYNVVHNGPSGWLTGVVIGHTFKSKLELDAEFYNQSTYNPYSSAPAIDVGGRYRIHKPIVLLMMAGRSPAPASATRPSFYGYFGLQFLLPGRAYDVDSPKPEAPHPPEAEPQPTL